MNWREYINTDPAILSGKPLIKGTRLSVDFLLGLLAEGWTEKHILENYPHLSHESLRALFAFSAECMRDEAIYPIISNNAKSKAKFRRYIRLKCNKNILLYFSRSQYIP